MSRSYRKPVFSDKKDRYWKKQANRTVRRTKDIANGRAYRKVICSYSICEFRYWILNPTDFWKKSITRKYGAAEMTQERKKRVLSGIQPTGQIHIGNYLGAVKQWVQMQSEYDCVFSIVDMHAITIPPFDPATLKKNVLDLAAILIACGIEPEKSVLFVQSDVHEHAELAWMLNCITPLGWLNRMTQFKQKSGQNKENASVGLYTYPALQAADILLYDADLVPVGEDQIQHVEITRDITQRFNHLFGETFKMPDYFIPETAARVMGMDDPTKKMSKSDAVSNHAIYLLDELDVIRRKIKRAVTDSERGIVFDEKREGLF